ncbi:hypothetical protein [Allomuricauda sp. F6463D]|uniref:hypothetical protein n=1 Tax=Allomuricauda sp. F6463D TaxID=2926409 RepID=UPI001FF30FA2|nr:hypothetical protein [Muricauda sp. F6463D]MCK0162071.1 hypothetical protein [Muricauda sp. F6463D]
MGIYDYMALCKDKQWEILWEDGIFLTSYKSIDCWFILYAIDKFFVELELCPLKGTILGMGVFVHGKKMDKYINGELHQIFGLRP